MVWTGWVTLCPPLRPGIRLFSITARTQGRNAGPNALKGPGRERAGRLRGIRVE
ncbi:hypothetical protein LIP_3226 [Limnochorda pilosa]|uniref:Uncharacterized protein n=1 Tax=Limnochorda pilosa TaxID=1555112 RepID=A0A0K2SPH7_LIMPI|nr:hypothetical protein LIP_3226 [Limnochorda pilosa]